MLPLGLCAYLPNGPGMLVAFQTLRPNDVSVVIWHNGTHPVIEVAAVGCSQIEGPQSTMASC